MSNDFGVGNIEEKKGLVGGVKYIIEGEKFSTLEEARQRRNAIIEGRRIQHENMEFERAQHEENKKLIDAYDQSPEYITAIVQTNPITDKETTFWGKMKETGLSAFIDPITLSDDLYTTFRKMAFMGYEVISVSPITSGIGAYHFPGGNVSGGAGWGYSFTSSVIVTARKKSTEV